MRRASASPAAWARASRAMRSSVALVATTASVVLRPFPTAPNGAPPRAKCVSASANVPSAARAPARTAPAPSRMLPTALSTTSAPTTMSPPLAAQLPTPPFMAARGPSAFPTVAPVPAPTDPSTTSAEAADVVEGSVGAGTGATVGKALGPRAAMKGGVGSWAASGGDIVVGALVVLNAVGNILDGAGAVLAGARAADGTFADALTHFARGGAPFGAVGKGRNTTLAVVATNATLDRIALEALAHAAGDALARRIVPYGTLFDGDVVFAVSTATAAPATPLQTEALAALAVPMAVERAVPLARGLRDIPGLADKGGR